MRVFLDDERDTPEGWVRVYWPDEAIALLESGKVSEMSLDHDLGDDKRGTGYDVVLWVEDQTTEDLSPLCQLISSREDDCRNSINRTSRAGEGLAAWLHTREHQDKGNVPFTARQLTLPSSGPAFGRLLESNVSRPCAYRTATDRPGSICSAAKTANNGKLCTWVRRLTGRLSSREKSV